MDWSKSKSIFIVVFLILNIFLYTQYVNVYTQGQKVEVLGEKTTEAQLKDDNITYITLPDTVDNVSYLSGKMRNFKENEVPPNNLVDIQIFDEYILRATFKNPISLKASSSTIDFKEFPAVHVHEGDKYVLWEVNEEQQYALYFQKVNDRTLYYNSSGYLKVYWDKSNEIYAYEQTMLEKVEKLKQKDTTIPPIQVLQALYSRNLLKADSRIIGMNLGYSTLVQLTQTQVFAPTWEVRVRNADGQTEEHFVNAFEGKVLEIQKTSNTLENKDKDKDNDKDKVKDEEEE